MMQRRCNEIVATLCVCWVVECVIIKFQQLSFLVFSPVRSLIVVTGIGIFSLGVGIGVVEKADYFAFF